MALSWPGGPSLVGGGMAWHGGARADTKKVLRSRNLFPSAPHIACAKNPVPEPFYALHGGGGGAAGRAGPCFCTTNRKQFLGVLGPLWQLWPKIASNPLILGCSLKNISLAAKTLQKHDPASSLPTSSGSQTCHPTFWTTKTVARELCMMGVPTPSACARRWGRGAPPSPPRPFPLIQ